MVFCRGKLQKGHQPADVRQSSPPFLLSASCCSLRFPRQVLENHAWRLLADTMFWFLCSDNSSQAHTRPPFHSENSAAAPSTRPGFNRQISTLSTHSASGRPHPPPAAEGRIEGTKPHKPKPKGKTLLNRIANQQAERTPHPIYSNGTQTSFNWRSGRPMAGMLELERSRTRRERTFIGSECAVCEEPLEHTLRGERILQFSCGHVSHEACFYEYIKEFDEQQCPTCNAPLGLDTSRGGNVLDLGNTPPQHCPGYSPH